MKFRLTYEGVLLSNGSANHKQDIRKALHPQLKNLWQVSPNLSKQTYTRVTAENKVEKYLLWEWLAHSGKFARHGYRFVPVAELEHEVLVSLDILFLRFGQPGHLVLKGDIDNRLKTLFDSLRMPNNAQEIGNHKPPEGEDPFFVLLEDDRQIARLSVETDDLLQPLTGKQELSPNDARVTITVEIHPWYTRPGNNHFA